jgi:hypothetical protein
MKSVLKTIQSEPCRVHEVTDNEMSTFSNYIHLQRYHPAIDLFKLPELESHKNLELPSKYNIDTWHSQDDNKFWNTTFIMLKDDKELFP